MKFNWVFGKVMIIGLVILSLVACTSNVEKPAVSTTPGSKESEKPNENTPSTKTTTIRFWHTFGGANLVAFEGLAEEFNKSQEAYVVEPLFQGGYEDMLLKFRNTTASDEAPSIIFVNDIATKAMISTEKILPVYTYMENEGYDNSKMLESISNYYTIEGKLYSMPVAASVPLVYYNKNLLKEAGFDPENPPSTYEGWREAAKKMTIKEGNKVTQYGFTAKLEPWYFEQLLAAQGGLLIDQDNGRNGEATKVMFNDEKGRSVLGLYEGLVSDESYGNFGDDWTQIRGAFVAEQVGFYFDSSGALRGIVDQLEDKFELGVAYMPTPEGVEWQGIVPGGGSVWMSNLVGEEENKGTWEFMKFLTSTRSQMKVHSETGYLANNVDSYNDPIIKELYTKYPQFEVAFNQLKDTKLSTATQGAFTPAMPDIRRAYTKAIELVLLKQEGLEKALAKAETEANRGIDTITRANR